MDRPAQHHRRSWFLVAVTTAGIIAACLTPVAAVGTRLLVADAAGEVATAGSLIPIASAIAKPLARAVVNAIVYL